nr:H/ACA ribonucleoprotein complex subunit 2-like protein isoform X1 [Cherax quadricarinatus]
MGKHKDKADEPDLDNSQVIEGEQGEVSYEDKVKCVSIIAQPMASKKVAGRLYKLIKKSSTHKTYLEASVKGVQKWLRKGMKGIVVFAGNVSPIEVMCHLPALCEDNQVPYIYTPSREDLGAAMGVTRGVLCVFVREHEDYKELYNKALDDIKKVPKMY